MKDAAPSRVPRRLWPRPPCEGGSGSAASVAAVFDTIPPQRACCCRGGHTRARRCSHARRRRRHATCLEPAFAAGPAASSLHASEASGSRRSRAGATRSSLLSPAGAHAQRSARGYIFDAPSDAARAAHTAQVKPVMRTSCKLTPPQGSRSRSCTPPRPQPAGVPAGASAARRG